MFVSSTAIASGLVQLLLHCLWLGGFTHPDSGPLEVVSIHEIYPYPTEHTGGSVTSITLIITLAAAGE